MKETLNSGTYVMIINDVIPTYTQYKLLKNIKLIDGILVNLSYIIFH